mmetsp:Transcript_15939/g.49422  ORF Transcript_15939/g.49422 Transcript_15939/m.49422 type:complete len:363 (+) Transcript_15939:354-1442(+)
MGACDHWPCSGTAAGDRRARIRFARRRWRAASAKRLRCSAPWAAASDRVGRIPRLDTGLDWDDDAFDAFSPARWRGGGAALLMVFACAMARWAFSSEVTFTCWMASCSSSSHSLVRSDPAAVVALPLVDRPSASSKSGRLSSAVGADNGFQCGSVAGDAAAGRGAAGGLSRPCGGVSSGNSKDTNCPSNSRRLRPTSFRVDWNATPVVRSIEGRAPTRRPRRRSRKRSCAVANGVIGENVSAGVAPRMVAIIGTSGSTIESAAPLAARFRRSFGRLFFAKESSPEATRCSSASRSCTRRTMLNPTPRRFGESVLLLMDWLRLKERRGGFDGFHDGDRRSLRSVRRVPDASNPADEPPITTVV